MQVRPIAMSDLATLVDLASRAGVGLTTLPSNEALLARRIEISNASFAGEADRADEMFMFVLCDTATGEVVGTAAIATAVGLRQAFYSYRVGLTVHASEELGIFTQTPTLFLSNDHTGNSELCSLFLDPEYRKGRNGSLLSKSRFLFIADFKARFSKTIIAELRGLSDANGRSPFWDGVGRHFFSMEFSRADYLTGLGKKSFVAELMPKHPLYSSLLSKEAQEAIGKTHELTRPAQAMLEEEGFEYENHVDIFDAGPTVECDVDKIGAVAKSQIYAVQITEDPLSTLSDPARSMSWLVSNRRFADYRCALVRQGLAASHFTLDPETAATLDVRAGDSVRAVPLSPKQRSH
jgi:arginine N-succinyltransferase